MSMNDEPLRACKVLAARAAGVWTIEAWDDEGNCVLLTSESLAFGLLAVEGKLRQLCIERDVTGG